jgi:hypothetical protein
VSRLAETHAIYEFIAALNEVKSLDEILMTRTEPRIATAARALSDGAELVSGSIAERIVSAISSDSIGISMTARPCFIRIILSRILRFECVDQPPVHSAYDRMSKGVCLREGR